MVQMMKDEINTTMSHFSLAEATREGICNQGMAKLSNSGGICYFTLG